MLVDSVSTSTEALTTIALNHRRQHCLVLRGISNMETELEATASRKHMTTEACADDINVLDIIEECYGVRPSLLSNRVINRRLQASSKSLYFCLLDVISQKYCQHSLVVQGKAKIADASSPCLHVTFKAETLQHGEAYTPISVQIFL